MLIALRDIGCTSSVLGFNLGVVAGQVTFLRQSLLGILGTARTRVGLNSVL
jgi:hypothetical protein